MRIPEKSMELLLGRVREECKVKQAVFIPPGLDFDRPMTGAKGANIHDDYPREADYEEAIIDRRFAEI
jgi:hypothetical protein